MVALSRARIIDAALGIVEAEGIYALTMRALAGRLGVAVTAIYWHVGNKEDLLAALVERIGAEVGQVRTTGTAPEERVISTARSLLRSIESHSTLVGLAHAQGHL